MRFTCLGKSVQPVTTLLVREKFLELIKLSIGRGWDRFPGMGRCQGKGTGQSYMHANKLLSMWQ